MNFLNHKFYTNLLCLATGFLFFACGAPKTDDEVVKFHEDCPVALGNFGEITSVTQSDTAVVFTVSINEDSLALDSSLICSATAEGFVRKMLSSKENSPKKLFAAMVSQRRALQYLYVGGKSGKTLRATIPGLRLMQIVDEGGHAIVDPDRKIRLATTDSLSKTIAEINKTLPKNLRQGLKLEKVTIEGGYFLFVFMLDGTGLSIDKVKNSPATVKADVLRRLPSISDFTRLCTPACLGLILRFRAPLPKKKGKDVRFRTEAILVTPDELSKVKV